MIFKNLIKVYAILSGNQEDYEYDMQGTSKF